MAISFIQGLQYSVSPILGDIQEHYPGVDISLIQMLITAPGLLSMAVSLASGWLVLKITKKQMLLFGALVAGITGFVPFLSDSFALLLGARICYGVGLGIATTMNVAVVAEFFEGNERVKAMGVQAASVGAGMVVATTAAGMLGKGGFQRAYFVNVIGFISLAVLLICLPETGIAKQNRTEKIKLNKKVLLMDLFGLTEFLFLITFTTNIAMHLSGAIAGDSSVSGMLTGCFSASQIVIGILLGAVTKAAKNYTLSAAMLSFSIGAAILILFPGHGLLLAVGAVFCGFSQGIFYSDCFDLYFKCSASGGHGFCGGNLYGGHEPGAADIPHSPEWIVKSCFWRNHNDRRLCSVSGRNADSSHGHGLVAEGPGRIS